MERRIAKRNRLGAGRILGRDVVRYTGVETVTHQRDVEIGLGV